VVSLGFVFGEALGFLGFWGFLGIRAPPVNGITGGAMAPDARVFGMGGSRNEPSHAGCMLVREIGLGYIGELGFWEVLGF